GHLLAPVLGGIHKPSGRPEVPVRSGILKELPWLQRHWKSRQDPPLFERYCTSVQISHRRSPPDEGNVQNPAESCLRQDARRTGDLIFRMCFPQERRSFVRGVY